ncbi:hypothetical protein GCM10010271_08180 [Streptomyces kurssanovii]|nr:hypothetical protein GCM10010271_08180 [Streptomyces kurssanovii]
MTVPHRQTSRAGQQHHPDESTQVRGAAIPRAYVLARRGRCRIWLLGAAVLGIVAGAVVLAVLTESADALTRLLGLWLVLLGLAEAVVALSWRAALARTHVPGPQGPPPAA